MVKCPKAGCEAECPRKFCPKCGTQVICSKCGEPLENNTCKKCGQSPGSTIAPGAGADTPSGSAPSAAAVAALSAIKAGKKITWRKGTLLGKGSFGSVYLGMLDEGKLSAVKLIELGNSEAPTGSDLDALNDEIRLMAQYKHENIVSYYGSCWNAEGNSIEVFLEYVAGGSLQSLYKQFDGFPETAVKTYTRQILQGLQYLHGNKVVHRDIKGDNILVANDGTVKLADFGCSKSLNTICSKTHGCKTMVGTPYWMAPEVIADDSGYGFKADIWSVGCTVCEMLSGKPPWPEFESMWSAIYHIANSSGPPPGVPKDIGPVTKDFLDRCFVRDVRERASAAELLEHPFCKNA